VLQGTSAMPRRRALTRSAVPATVGIAALLLAGVAVVMASHSRKPASTPAVAVLGLQTTGSSSVLRRYDPLTLRRVGRRSLALRFGLGTWSASPDGSMLALGASLADVVTVIDPRTLRPRSSTSLRGSGYVSDIAWLAGGSLAVLSTGPRCCGLDATTLSMLAEPGGKLLWQHHFGDGLVDAASANGRLAFLLVPRDRIGPPQLVTWTSHGGGSVTVPGMAAGFAHPRRGQRVTPLTLTPGLALDRRGRRAYVVSPSGAVARVELAGMSVRTRQTRVERFLPRRLPAAVRDERAETMAAPAATRRALLAGPHTLAVWGDDQGVRRLDGGWTAWSRPSGLCLVDTRSWRVTRIDRTTDDARRLSGVIVATGNRAASAGRPPSGYGVSGYGPGGRRRFRLLAGRAVFLIGDGARRETVEAFVRGTHPAWVELDAAQGRIVRELRHEPVTLLGPSPAGFGLS
jgi:hypothetical protein